MSRYITGINGTCLVQQPFSGDHPTGLEIDRGTEAICPGALAICRGALKIKGSTEAIFAVPCFSKKK